ncbi:hypothetical protein NL676_031034 [Syzygium grande]|nr:hypothetical protein NL676_031034 [Syzygium grande]
MPRLYSGKGKAQDVMHVTVNLSPPPPFLSAGDPIISYCPSNVMLLAVAISGVPSGTKRRRMISHRRTNFDGS